MGAKYITAVIGHHQPVLRFALSAETWFKQLITRVAAARPRHHYYEAERRDHLAQCHARRLKMRYSPPFNR